MNILCVNKAHDFFYTTVICYGIKLVGVHKKILIVEIKFGGDCQQRSVVFGRVGNLFFVKERCPLRAETSVAQNRETSLLGWCNKAVINKINPRVVASPSG